MIELLVWISKSIVSFSSYFLALMDCSEVNYPRKTNTQALFLGGFESETLWLSKGEKTVFAC